MLGLTMVASALFAVAACDSGDGGGTSLPSTRPSVTLDRTNDATTGPGETTAPARTLDPARTTEPERTRTTNPEPDRTTEPEPDRTTQPEPDRTTEPEPDRTTEAQPAGTATTDGEPTPGTTTAARTPTPAATSESAAAVPVADDSGTGSLFAFFLIFLLIGGVIAAVLIARSRRKGAWDTESNTLTAGTRALLDHNVPRVLATTTPADRRLAWPPVRDQVLALINRWENLSARAVDGARQAASGQVVALLGDLVAAVDDESAAQSAARDWRLLRPPIETVLDALYAALAPTLPVDSNTSPGYGPGADEPPSPGRPGPEPYAT